MSHAAQAYARTSQATANPREIEAQALLMAARKLQDVQTNWAGPDQNLHKALLFNRRLWSIFMSAVEANDNPQPVEVRQNIANIGVFRHAADGRNAIESGSGETEIADRHQLQYRGGSRRQGLRADTTATKSFRPCRSDFFRPYDRWRQAAWHLPWSNPACGNRRGGATRLHPEID